MLRNIALIFATVLLSTACATDRMLTRSGLSSISNIEVIKPAPVPVMVRTLSGGILMASGGWLTAPLGASKDESATKRMQSEVQLPDFTTLLVREFVKRAPKEVPGWPPTAITSNVPAGYRAADGSAVLSFDLKDLQLSVLRGLTVEVTGTMADANGKAIWSKHFWFRSWDFGRSGDESEYIKNKYSLLKQEIPLAAKDITTVMLDDLKRGFEQ